MPPFDLEKQRTENTTKILNRITETVAVVTEVRHYNLKVVQTAYPQARISNIAGNTYRVNIFEKTTGIIPVNKLTYSFLVDVVGGLAIRRPEPTSHRLVKYSDKWKV